MRLSSGCLACLAQILLAAPTRTASAQASSDTSIVPWKLLSERPRLLDTTSTGGVHFPAMLHDANIEGDVRLVMIVDRNGAPEPQGVVVAASTHGLFTSAARAAVSKWTFSPAMLDGRQVRTVVPVTMSFVLRKAADGPTREVAHIDVDTNGVHVVVGEELIPRDSSLKANPADVRAVTVAALSELLPAPTADVKGAVCVTWNTSDRKVPADVMTHLRTLYPPLLGHDKCPPTYSSMILQVDSLGRPVERPPGAVDPLWIDVRVPEAWTRDVYVVHGSASRGTGSNLYRCTARRERPSGIWKAKCVRTGFAVS